MLAVSRWITRYEVRIASSIANRRHARVEQGACRRASPLGYTRNVPFWSHRLACVALAFALSGSHAGLAACMTFCVDSPVTTAGHAGHGGYAGEAVPEAASHAHGHNHDAAGAPTTTEAGHLPSAPRASHARVVATCGDCCLAGRSVLVVGLRAERRDADVGGVAPSGRIPPVDLSAAVQVSLPIPPTPPAKTLLALRI